MKIKMKRLLAVLLLCATVFSMLPANAWAAEGSDPTDPAATPTPTPTPTPAGITGTVNARDQINGKPNLYVHFLGDNVGHNDKNTDADGSEIGVIDKGLAYAPTPKNWHTDDPAAEPGKWSLYTANDCSQYGEGIIFWVGVGMDRMDVYDLFKKSEENGLYSLELGFYYNSEFVEPYIHQPYTSMEENGYLKTLQMANLTQGGADDTVWANSEHVWGTNPGDYEIVTAKTDLPPQTDWVTQEVLERSYASIEAAPSKTLNPDMNDIMGKNLPEGAGNPWRLTYAALECVDPEAVLERFSGYYSAEKAAAYQEYAENQASDTPDDTIEKPDDKAPEYFFIIPFRLKKYDNDRKLCFRLARNAHLFSMGASADAPGVVGADAYAAWDRVTTRNDGADIKLMSNFAGDLNIFTGKNEPEDPLGATLEILRGGSVSNTADLHLTNDPGPVAVHVNSTGETISGLYGGTGMEVKVNCATGFDVKVEAFRLHTENLPENERVRIPVDIIKEKDTYRFVMPEYDVHVRVTFTSIEGVTDYRIVLDEDRSQVVVPKDEEADPMPEVVGNKTTITAVYTKDEKVDAFSKAEDALDSHSVDSATTDPTVELTTGAYDKNHKTMPYVMARAQDTNGVNDKPPKPGDKVHIDPVTIKVETHEDYDAIVTIYNTLDKELTADGTFRGTTPVPNENQDDNGGNPVYCSVFLENGGEITFDMPLGDLIVDVKYVPAAKRTVSLEVHHAKDVTVLDTNVAQLEFDYYKIDNKPYRTYSGIVYHQDKTSDGETSDDEFSKIKEPWKAVPAVDKSSAWGSGSYAGDGVAAEAWENVMLNAYQAAENGTLDAYLDSILPRDLRAGEGSNPVVLTLIYRTLGRDRYRDSTIGEFRGALKALLEAIRADETTYRAYVDRTETKVPEGGTTPEPDPTQYHFTLTWKQVQLFLMAYDSAKPAETLTAAMKAMEGDTTKGAANSEAAVNAAYDALKWEDPTGVATYQDKAQVITRQGRTVSVLLESDNRYIADVTVWNKDGDKQLTDVTVSQHPDYQNVYQFTMPKEDCIVKVTYRLRATPTLNLVFAGQFGSEDNIGVAQGYGPQVDSIYPAQVTLDKPDTWSSGATTLSDTGPLFSGTQVSVKVGVGSDYRLSATVATAGGSVATVPGTITSLKDEQIFTFTMPTTNATITLTYSDPPAKKSTATLITADQDAAAPTSPLNTGYLEKTDPHSKVRHQVPEGENVAAQVHVEPGYYIFASWAQTEAGQPVSYIASGNGYNSGNGGDVTLSADMPGENLELYVIFAYGEPPEDPYYALQLKTDHINDEEKDGGNQAQIYSISAPGDYQGKGDAGGWVIDDTLTPAGDELTNYRTFVPAGRDVVVAVKKPAEDYFVSKVEITPSSLGVDVNWIAKPASATDPAYDDAKFLQFTSPGGPVVVTVYFEKEDPDHKEKGTYFLNVDKSEWDATANQFIHTIGADSNHIHHVFTKLLDETLLAGGGSYVRGTGYTVDEPLPQWIPKGYDIPNTIGAARPGDEVTLKIRIQKGWYIDAITLNSAYGNAPSTISNPGDPSDAAPWDNRMGTSVKEVEAKFFMPSANTSVVVHFRNDDVDRAAHRLGLRVRDPENTGDAKADNWALLTVEHLAGGSDTQLGKFGLGTSAKVDGDSKPITTGRTYDAKFGDKVTLTFSAAAGYYLDYIRMGPAGTTVIPVYVDSNTVEFTMPDRSVEVEVRFRKGTAPQYTADLILRPPTGTNPATGRAYTAADVGAGSFVTKNGVSITWTTPDPADDTAVIPHTASLADPIYSQVGTPGTELGYTAKANDGFYIKRVTVTPATTGVVPTLTGSFGVQGGVFRMPPAHVYVNVWFEVGWPDTAKYDLTVKVTDPSFNGTADAVNNNNAYLERVNYTDWTPVEHVYGGQQVTHREAAKDQELAQVAIRKVAGHRVASITVETANGVAVPWWYAPGGIRFYMPAEAVTVHVTFGENPGDGPGPNPVPDEDLHTLTLVVTDPTTDMTNTATVTDNGAVTLTQTGAGTVTQADVPVGTAFAVTATPDTEAWVKVLYALDGEGNLITDPVKAGKDGNGVCTDGFAMPNSDATVYVTFVNKKGGGDDEPSADDRQGILQVTGPVGSGSAVMTAADSEGHPVAATGTVAASGLDTLYAETGTTMKVDITVASGHLLKSLRVVELDTGASVPYLWTGTGTAITFPMPGSGVLVQVELEKNPAPRTYTVQLVVNDTVNTAIDADKRSRAGLGRTAADVWDSTLTTPDVTFPAPKTRVDYMDGLDVGDDVFLGLHVAPGYAIESLVVVSQSHGIHPALEGNTLSQATSFRMPADDIVVYVKFGGDERQRYNAVLDVTGCDDETEYNRGSIHSEFTGLEGPIASADAPVTVWAAAESQDAASGAWYPGEWVTVKYGNHPDLIQDGKGGLKDGYIVDNVLVTSNGAAVPYTQVSEWEIRFPMIEAQVNVEVQYAEGDERKGEQIVLHLVDETGAETTLTGVSDNWAQVLWRTATGTMPPQPVNPPVVGTNATAKISLPNSASTEEKPIKEVTDDTLKVPAGETVDVECFAGAADGKQLYIRGAYVLLEETHQMIYCNLPKDATDHNKDFLGEYSQEAAGNGTGHGNASFMVHRGTNHVYVYVTDVKPDPDQTRYSAVLTLTGPEEDKTSNAVISSTGAAPDDKATAMINKGHTYITVNKDNTVTVQVNPTSGYEIDYVRFSPLDIDKKIDVKYTVTQGSGGNTFTFVMPGENIGIHVHLRSGAAKKYNLVFHVEERPKDSNEGELSFTDSTGKVYTHYKGGSYTKNQTTGDKNKTNRLVAPEGATVTLDTWMNKDNYILHAFAIQSSATSSKVSMVPLTTALEEKTDGHPSDAGVVDATTTFAMPGADVDVYLVYTKTPPKAGWHTAVLVATDTRTEDEDTIVDSGLNKGDFNLKAKDTAINENVSDKTVWSFGQNDPDQAGIDAGRDQSIYCHVVYPGDAVTVDEIIPNTNYQFDPPASISIGATGTAPTLNTLSNSGGKFSYGYTVGDSNAAVQIHFVGNSGARQSELTVRIVDPDNPGDGTVDNTVITTPPGTGVVPLSLHSTTSAGAAQFIPNVVEGETVKFTATPDADWSVPDGCQVMARYSYDDGTGGETTGNVALTANGGSFEGQFTMPGAATTLTVYFYKPYTATLELKDLKGDLITTAETWPTMVEDTFGGKAQVNDAAPVGVLENLPNATKLTTTVPALPEGAKLVGVLLTTDKGTSLMTVEEDGLTYLHTIDRSDVTVTVVVDERKEGEPTPPESYVAAVRTVGMPEGTTAPTIATSGTAAAAGSIWTTALKDETITVNVTVPEGYKAVITAVNTTDSSDVIAAPGTELTATGDATFTMPAGNVQVTVTYVKTRIDLTLALDGPDGMTSTAELDTLVVNDATRTQTIEGVTKDDLKTVTVTVGTDEYLWAVVHTKADGSVEQLTTAETASPYAYSVTVPDGDSTVTVIIRKTQPGTEPGPGPDAKPYLVNIVKAGAAKDVPGNDVVRVTDLNGVISPDPAGVWALAYPGDDILGSYTVAPGYHATVTATVPVVQQDIGPNGTGQIKMPAANATITVTYAADTETPDPTNVHNIDFRIVGHGGVEANTASLYAGSVPSGTALNTAKGSENPDGTEVRHDKVGTAAAGDALSVGAYWSTDPLYRVVRVTLTVNGYEIDVPFNPYTPTALATSVFSMPSADVLVTVYYERVYTLTLSVSDTTPSQGASATTDGYITDDPVTITDTAITNDPSITGFLGDHEERASTEVTVPSDGKLLGVVRTGRITGALDVPGTVPDGGGTAGDPYDFEMPKCDTTVTPVVVDKDGPFKDAHIARVAIDSGSEGLDVTANDADIENLGSYAPGSAPPSGKYWTVANKDDPVEITVHLAAGYQAQVTAIDPDGLYVTRQFFLNDGETARFAMPDSDAQVTVKFIQGYTATLVVTDTTGQANTATMVGTPKDGAETTVTGSSDTSGAVTYAGGPATKHKDNDSINHMEAGAAVTGGTTANGLDASATPAQKPRVVRSTVMTGSVTVPVADDGSGGYTYAGAIPGDARADPYVAGEDAEFHVILDNRPLLAKVELRGKTGGETAITGNNGAVISNTSDNTAPQGTIWVTANGNNEIHVDFTIAKGYRAEVKIRKDDYVEGDEKYLDAASTAPMYEIKKDGVAETIGDTFGYSFTGTGNISSHTLDFRIAGEEKDVTPYTGVTVIIEYSYAGAIAAPHDPGHGGSGDWTLGYIGGENRSSYAVIDVPTLFDGADYFDADDGDDDHDMPTNTSEYIQYKFFIKKDGKYVELVEGVDIELTPVDGATKRGPYGYNYDNRKYTGDPWQPDTSGTNERTAARFNLALKEATPTSDQAKALAAILNNNGTTGAGAGAGTVDEGPTELYIVAQNHFMETSDYVQVKIDPVVTINGTFASWGPTHAAKVSLYPIDRDLLKDDNSGELADPDKALLESSYPTTRVEGTYPDVTVTDLAVTSIQVKDEWGTDYWEQDFAVGSSKLLDLTYEDGTPMKIFMLEIAKPGHVTYRRVNLDISGAREGTNTYYDADAKTFTIQGFDMDAGDKRIVDLIPGDMDGDREVNNYDQFRLADYLERRLEWTTETDETATDWATSVYNPASGAYGADLDGDGNISDADFALLRSYNPSNYRWSYEKAKEGTDPVYDYWEDSKWTVPNGFEYFDQSGAASASVMTMALFAMPMDWEEEPVGMETDAASPVYDPLMAALYPEADAWELAIRTEQARELFLDGTLPMRYLQEPELLKEVLDELPAPEELPVEGEAPVEGELPVEGETPAEGEVPIEQPAEGEQPQEPLPPDQPPVEEETPALPPAPPATQPSQSEEDHKGGGDGDGDGDGDGEEEDSETKPEPPAPEPDPEPEPEPVPEPVPEVGPDTEEESLSETGEEPAEAGERPEEMVETDLEEAQTAD